MKEERICETCGTVCEPRHFQLRRLCLVCFEVESNIDEYARRGGVRARHRLVDALTMKGERRELSKAADGIAALCAPVDSRPR